MMKAEQVSDHLFIKHGLMGVCVCVFSSVLKKVLYAHNNQWYVLSVQIIRT
jgi:hypothetical protein